MWRVRITSRSDIRTRSGQRTAYAVKDTLTKTTSLSTSLSCVKGIMINQQKTLRIRCVADMKRPSGGREGHAGRVIPCQRTPPGL